MVKKYLYFILCFLFLNSCSSSLVNPIKPLSLNKIDQADLATMSPEKAITSFGKPDVRDFVDAAKKQEALVYFDSKVPGSTRLSLIFDSATQELISANWFLNETDAESDFSKIQKRYPQAQFDFKNPIFIKEGLYGLSVNRYDSAGGPLRVFVDSDSKKVSALSWSLKKDLLVPKRKPTSH